MTPFEELILMKMPADYQWSDAGIVRIGENRDIAAYAVGDFTGMCLIFCHGNGETAVSEKYWFEALAKQGISVVCPDYRGYGLSVGDMSEKGCYAAAHAAYDWLVKDKGVQPQRIAVLGYSLGSAIAVELVTTVKSSALILQAPFLSGAALRPVWEKRLGIPSLPELDAAFPTEGRLPCVNVPTLVIHGTSDVLVPVEQGRSVYEKIGCADKELKLVEGAGHCDFQFHLGDEYVKSLTAFLEKFEQRGLVVETSTGLKLEIFESLGMMPYGKLFKCHLCGDSATTFFLHSLRDGFLEQRVKLVESLKHIDDTTVWRIIDVFRHDGTTFLLSENIEDFKCSSLARIMLSGVVGVRLPKCDVLLAFARYAHALSKVSHLVRDLDVLRPDYLYYPKGKPQNAMLCPMTNDWYPYLGLAGDHQVSSYLSPEVLMGKQAGIKSLLFSLGLLLYEALSGIKVYYEEGDSTKFIFRRLDELKRHVGPVFNDPVVNGDRKLFRLLKELTEVNPDTRIADPLEVERRLLDMALDCIKTESEKGDRTIAKQYLEKLLVIDHNNDEAERLYVEMNSNEDRKPASSDIDALEKRRSDADLYVRRHGALTGFELNEFLEEDDQGLVFKATAIRSSESLHVLTGQKVVLKVLKERNIKRAGIMGSLCPFGDHCSGKFGPWFISREKRRIFPLRHFCPWGRKRIVVLIDYIEDEVLVASESDMVNVSNSTCFQEDATKHQYHSDENLCTKPVIYLYPTITTKCSVKVLLDGDLTCVYPQCGAEGWRDFTAAPDGTMTFPNGMTYYCLFWEGISNSKWDFSHGYCIEGCKVGEFLATTLTRMGMTEREANEMIIYWLPRMQNNAYNVIAFQGAEYTDAAKLEITPQPDSVLRVFMAWYASNRKINIPSPVIMPFERVGFTVVEWGGTEVYHST